MNFAACVVTTPRDGADYLPATLDALHCAGFTPDVFRDDPATGAYPAFKRALRGLVRRLPGMDGYLMFQDDIRVALNLEPWLQANLWPGRLERIGCCSLYCPTPYDVPTDGWHQLDLGPQDDGMVPWSKGGGALGYVFPRHAAERFCSINHSPESMNQVDHRVAEWCMEQRLDYWRHSPSFLDHTGEVSTFGVYNGPMTPLVLTARRAGRFCPNAMPD